MSAIHLHLHRLQKRIAMAAGREPADLLILNAQVVDVFTGQVRQSPVSVGDGVFLGYAPCEARVTLDAQGAFLLPGLIDAHIHIESSMASPARFAELVLPHGTTSVVADPHEIANVLGMRGLRYLLQNALHLPLNLFVALPSCVPATSFEDAGAVLEAEDLAQFIDNEHVTSIGEMMNFPGVVAGDPAVLRKLLLGLAHGKQLDGHAPGVLGQALDAYLVTGISNTHECSTLEELEENLRRGSYVFLREGSAARNLVALLPGITPTNARRCAFCCDDRHAEDIMQYGHMDNILRVAVAHGLDAITAVTMCTLNAAEACGLAHKGAIAPGRDADFILVDDLTHFHVRHVYAAGQAVISHERLIVPLTDTPFPENDLGGVAGTSVSVGTEPAGKPPKSGIANTVHVAPLTEHSFDLPIPSLRARVIGLQAHSLVTLSLERPVKVNDKGLFEGARNPGLSKIAVVERHKATGLVGVGLLEGYGITGGAVATTIAHDSHNIVVVGDNDPDMRLAVEALARMGGGIVLCSHGQILAELALPLAGLMSTRHPKEVSEQLGKMLHTARTTLNISGELDPFMTLSFMALPVIPQLKITARGLFDVDAFTFVQVNKD